MAGAAAAGQRHMTSAVARQELRHAAVGRALGCFPTMKASGRCDGGRL